MYDDVQVYVNTADANAALTGVVRVHKVQVENADGLAAVSVKLNDNLTVAGAATAVVNVGGAKAGATATGLDNDATAYTATAVIDGTTRNISVVGSDAQTYTDLLSELNTDSTGGTWTLAGGNLLLTSATTSQASNIVLTDGTLFAALTGFVAIHATKRPGLAKVSCTTRQRYALNFDRMASVDFDPPVLFNVGVSADHTGTGTYRIYYTL